MIMAILLVLFVILCCSLYYDMDMYSEVINHVPELEEPINCCLVLLLWDAVVPIIDYGIQVYIKSTRKTLLVYFLVHLIISLYAAVGLDIIYKNDAYDTNIRGIEEYKGETDAIKALFWLIILPLVFMGPLALIGICICFC